MAHSPGGIVYQEEVPTEVVGLVLKYIDRGSGSSIVIDGKNIENIPEDVRRIHDRVMNGDEETINAVLDETERPRDPSKLISLFGHDIEVVAVRYSHLEGAISWDAYTGAGRIRKGFLDKPVLIRHYK